MKKKPVKNKQIKKKELDRETRKFVKGIQKIAKKTGNKAQEKLELILALTLQTAALELQKNEYIELAPLPGVCSPFRLSGNSLPVFEYIVFEKKIMEFIKVRVEIAKPDRIDYIATIDCRGIKGEHSEASRHGQQVEVKAEYMAPFEKLAAHLKAYFPYWRSPSLERNPNRWDKPKTMDSELSDPITNGSFTVTLEEGDLL